MKRRVEMLLCVVGVSLLGVAFGETLTRWNYQTQQERAFAPVAAVSAPAPARTPATAPVVVPAPSFSPAPLPAPQPDPPGAPPAPDPPRVRPKVARIEIPRIGISAIISEGADAKTLARAVGRVPESARPGELGNLVLAAHRDTFFRPLRKIEVNDRIRLIVPPHTYEYEVQSMRVVDPEETSVLQSNGVEELTLVTCYPFGYIGPAPQRFIVRASRVE